MFDLIVMSEAKQFLSRKKCQTAMEAAQAVAALLAKDIVGSISIRRSKEKAVKEPPAS